MKNKERIKVHKNVLLSLFLIIIISIVLPHIVVSSNVLTPSSSQVSKEIVKVDSQDIPIWKAKINLNDPHTVFEIISDVEVNKVGDFTPGGFSKFAKEAGAAFLANTTFKDEKRETWTMVSRGSIINGAISKQSSKGTVLGLKNGNKPEMISRAEGVVWENYWFAITSSPRLLEHGNISKELSFDQSDKAQRSAIGFSKSDSDHNVALYHVITDEQQGKVTPTSLAKIMSDIGCYEAMMLEGGNGVLMATSKDIFVDDARDNQEMVRAPIIAVYDSANPPSNSLLKAWKKFQSEHNP